MAALDVIVMRVLAWMLVLLFALVLGGQAFDAFVLVPIWSEHPPESVDRWLDTPAAGRVPRFFIRLLPPLLIISLAAAACALFTHVRLTFGQLRGDAPGRRRRSGCSGCGRRWRHRPARGLPTKRIRGHLG